MIRRKPAGISGQRLRPMNSASEVLQNPGRPGPVPIPKNGQLKKLPERNGLPQNLSLQENLPR